MRRTRTSRLVNLLVFGAVGLLGGTEPAFAQAPQPRPGVSLTDSRIGMRVAPIMLLTRPDIQLELKLSAEQVASASAMSALLHDRAAQLRGRADNDALRAQTEIMHTGTRWIKEHLTVEQQDRLVQLDLQWEGPSSLLRPIVKETLRLEDIQIAALAKAVAERNTRRNGGPAVAADEVALFKTAIGMLSEPQVKSWRAMLGPIAPFQAAIHPMHENTVVR